MMTDIAALNTEIIAPLPGEFTPTAWIPPDNLTFEQAGEVGQGLSLAKGAINWWIGDWYLAIESRFSKRERYAQLLDATQFVYGSLRNNVWVAAQIPPFLRSNNSNVFWTHHKHAAPFDHATIKILLDRAVKRGWSTRTMRNVIRRWQRMVHGEPARIGKGKQGAAVSYLPVPESKILDRGLAANPITEDRTVWTAELPETTYTDWRKVSKIMWKRSRHWRKRAAKAEDQVTELRREVTELIDDNIQLQRGIEPESAGRPWHEKANY